jgi:hypothetical protein
MTSFSGRKHTTRETKCDSGACQLPSTERRSLVPCRDRLFRFLLLEPSRADGAQGDDANEKSIESRQPFFMRPHGAFLFSHFDFLLAFLVPYKRVRWPFYSPIRFQPNGRKRRKTGPVKRSTILFALVNEGSDRRVTHHMVRYGYLRCNFNYINVRAEDLNQQAHRARIRPVSVHRPQRRRPVLCSQVRRRFFDSYLACSRCVSAASAWLVAWTAWFFLPSSIVCSSSLTASSVWGLALAISAALA